MRFPIHGVDAADFVGGVQPSHRINANAEKSGSINLSPNLN
jgi:hypothetical protein